jgi:hypothetical protein
MLISRQRPGERTGGLTLSQWASLVFLFDRRQNACQAKKMRSLVDLRFDVSQPWGYANAKNRGLRGC